MTATCLMAAAAIGGGAATVASAQTAPEAPANLQVNLLTNPMAVPLTGVHFSWATRDSRAGESQQGYQIRVASSPSTVTSGSANDAVFGQPGQPPPGIPEDSGIGAGPLNGALPPPSSGGTAPSAPNAKVSGYPTTLVDWPPGERGGFVFERENTVVNAFAYAAYNAMAQIAATTGNAPDASSYPTLAARLKSAIQSNLYDPATGAFYDGVGTSREAIQSSSYSRAWATSPDFVVPEYLFGISPRWRP